MELLERNHALCQLDAALKDATAGQGRIVLVSGEAGIGKTSLIDRFTAVHRASTRVLWGACDALFTPRPLGPLYDIAAQMQGDLLTQLTAQANRTVLYSSFLNDLQQRPSIVVFEDVHWADEATLDVLTFLGRRLQRVPSVLILTYRDDEIGLRLEPPLLAEVVGAESLAVDECMEMGMLIAQGEALAFRHELARQTILE